MAKTTLSFPASAARQRGAREAPDQVRGSDINTLAIAGALTWLITAFVDARWVPFPTAHFVRGRRG